MTCKTCKGFGYLLTTPSTCSAGGDRVACTVFTPSQRLDAATVERLRVLAAKLDMHTCTCGGPCGQRPPEWMGQDAKWLRALATEPHQHGGKGA